MVSLEGLVRRLQQRWLLLILIFAHIRLGGVSSVSDAMDGVSAVPGSSSNSVGVTTERESTYQLPRIVRSNRIGVHSRLSAMSSHLASMSEGLHNLSSQLAVGSGTHTGPVSFESTLRERLHLPDPPTGEE